MWKSSTNHWLSTLAASFPYWGSFSRIHCLGISLVVQGLRICLPMQGTRIWSLVQEDPTCRGTRKPVRHSYWSLRAWSPCSATREATTISLCTARKSRPCWRHLEKALFAATKTQHSRKQTNKRCLSFNLDQWKHYFLSRVESHWLKVFLKYLMLIIEDGLQNANYIVNPWIGKVKQFTFK